MRTFLLRDGDFDLNGDRYRMVEGTARLQQQVGLCVREPWQIDRFHPGWGSVLPNWIGNSIIDRSVDMDVGNEIRRVVRNFAASTAGEVRRRANLGLQPVMRPSEVLSGVMSITIRHQLDRLYVRTVLTTASQTEFTIIATPGAF